jgi:hypothetical protein
MLSLTTSPPPDERTIVKPSSAGCMPSRHANTKNGKNGEKKTLKKTEEGATGTLGTDPHPVGQCQQVERLARHLVGDQTRVGGPWPAHGRQKRATRATRGALPITQRERVSFWARGAISNDCTAPKQAIPSNPPWQGSRQSPSVAAHTVNSTNHAKCRVAVPEIDERTRNGAGALVLVC